MKLRPVTLRDANAFVATHHRHHKPARGCCFCISVVNEKGEMLGVAIVGRPSSRMLDNGETCEVTRLCVAPDPEREGRGYKNVCSMLYAACARTAKAIGYTRIVTYILEEESGFSLEVASWTLDGASRGGSWSRESRHRESENTQPKKRYSKALNG